MDVHIISRADERLPESGFTMLLQQFKKNARTILNIILSDLAAVFSKHRCEDF
jgi:hypothetical protein